MPIRLTIEEAEKLLLVDKNQLDDDLAMQPDTYYRVAKASALAAADKESAKYDAEKIVAETDARIRSELQDESDQDPKRKKPTEAEIGNNVRLDRTVDAAHRRSAKRTAEAGQWKALELAFAQRSHVLRDLTNLYTASYFQAAAGDNRATAQARNRVGEAATKTIRERSTAQRTR